MPKIHVPKFAVLVACTVVSISALGADPTLHQVYQAADAGNYREAQTMMDQVLRDHPNSAKAHFVEAELLAKQGGIANARGELGKAERLDPALAFAKPGAIQELKAHIGTSRASPQSNFSSVAPPSPNIPWGMILTILALIAAMFFFFRSRNRNLSAQGASGPGYGPTGTPVYGTPGYGTMPPSAASGMGSGILGGLATGAAMGAGMVAGEALMHRMMDGGHREDGYRQADPGFGPQAADPQYDMGGNDFGVSDTSSWDDAGGGGSDDWN